MSISTQPVPLLDLQAQFATIRDEVLAAVTAVIESQRFILGPEVEALEREVAEYSNCKYGVGVSSGTDALLVALMALGVEPGDEIITTPYTFFATAGSVHRVGAKPVFVDILPDTYNVDPSAVEKAVNKRTKAIIPVHLFGQVADIDPIIELGRAHGIPVVEDAAQAIGAERRQNRAGSFGDLACFSFFPSKNLGGFGDGGMVTTNSPELADRIRLLRNHGYRPKYFNRVVGGNFRLDAIQAAVLRVKLRYLEGWTNQRRENAAHFRELLSGLTQVTTPIEESECRHIYNQFVIRVSGGDRDGLMMFLKEQGVGCEIYYPVPLHLQDCFSQLSYAEGDFPESERAARETLAIPIYPELSTAQRRSVADATRAFFSR